MDSGILDARTDDRRGSIPRLGGYDEEPCTSISYRARRQHSAGAAGTVDKGSRAPRCPTHTAAPFGRFGMGKVMGKE